MNKVKILSNSYFLILLSLSLYLLLTALPQVRASLNHLSVDVVMHQFNQHKQPELKKMGKLIADSQKSISLTDHPRYWADLSRLFFFQAQKIRFLKGKQREYVEKTQQTLMESLSRSPANAYLWYQLARIDTLLNQVSNKTYQALTLSMMIGPYELGYLLPRLQLSLALYSTLKPQDLWLLRSQVLIAWKKSRKRFIQKIVLQNNQMGKIRFLLKNHSPDVLAMMEREIDQTSQ